MKIAFLLYSTRNIVLAEHTSFWIMDELIKRGHTVSYFESHELIATREGLFTEMTTPDIDMASGRFKKIQKSKKPVNLLTFDCLFIRKEPPFNLHYLYTLQLLDLIKDKVFILNDPAGIALANEKTFILNFKEYCPPSLVTGNNAHAFEFIKKLKSKVVIKPLNQKGGKGIFLVNSTEKNLPLKLKQATENNRQKIIIQKFVL